MDYEEKVRLAKEALESGSYDKDTIEYIFPELKESEDERIRKALITYLKSISGDSLDLTLRTHDWLAWLEKQGEQKPVEMSRVEDSQYYYNIHRILEGLKYNDNYGRTAIDAAINWFDSIKNFGYTKWSKEDEELLNLLCGRLIYSNIQEKEKFVMWLGKLTPIEQNSAWSEEDEKILSDIIKDLVHPWNEYIPDRIEDEIKWLKNKLKSLRPQSQWRPSDEQMDALESAIVDSISSIQKHSLESLYNELKKLF